MTTYYRMADATGGGMLETPAHELAFWNERQFGIYWTLNTFRGARRLENLERVEWWAIDLDEEPKAQQYARIMDSPLIPTRVIETKRGFHVYWKAIKAIAAHWRAIVEDRLIPHFHADKGAKDLARVLRAPGFLHWKDPANPYLVRERCFHEGTAYYEHQMAAAFKSVRTPKDETETARRAFLVEANRSRAQFPASNDFWERVDALDCEEGLQRLSGHWACGGEQFTFRRLRSGNLNVLTDGKPCGAWIDAQKRIGSFSRGGPNLAMWVRYYNHDWGTVAQVMKSIYPQLEERK